MTVLPRRLTALLIVLTLAGLPTSLWAQTRSETGRHKPQPKLERKTETETTETQAPTALPGSGWTLALGPGFQGGGELFRAGSPNAIYWQTVTGLEFPSSRFSTGLDTGFQLGMTLTRRLGQFLSLRGELGWAQQDVAAEALLGQTGAVFHFDTMTALTAALGLETRLVRLPSHPYLAVAAVYQDLSFDMGEALNQSHLGALAALGYRHQVTPRATLAVEGRLMRIGFEDPGYLPATVLPDQVVTLEAEDSLTFFGIQAKIELNF